MTSKDSNKRRIVYVDSFYGNYQIQKKVRFLFFWERWTGTHLFTSLEAAKAVLEYTKTLPEFGDILVSDTD